MISEPNARPPAPDLLAEELFAHEAANPISPEEARRMFRLSAILLSMMLVGALLMGVAFPELSGVSSDARPLAQESGDVYTERVVAM
jgi:hypothetical protein